MIQFYLGYENQVYIKVITLTSSGPEFRLEVLPEEQKIGGRIDTSFAANWIFLRVPREGRAEGELNFGAVKLLSGGENEERCSDYTKRKERVKRDALALGMEW